MGSGPCLGAFDKQSDNVHRAPTPQEVDAGLPEEPLELRVLLQDQACFISLAPVNDVRARLLEPGIEREADGPKHAVAHTKESRSYRAQAALQHEQHAESVRREIGQAGQVSSR